MMNILKKRLVVCSFVLVCGMIASVSIGHAAGGEEPNLPYCDRSS